MICILFIPSFPADQLSLELCEWCITASWKAGGSLESPMSAVPGHSSWCYVKTTTKHQEHQTHQPQKTTQHISIMAFMLSHHSTLKVLNRWTVPLKTAGSALGLWSQRPQLWWAKRGGFDRGGTGSEPREALPCRGIFLSKTIGWDQLRCAKVAITNACGTQVFDECHWFQTKPVFECFWLAYITEAFRSNASNWGKDLLRQKLRSTLRMAAEHGAWDRPRLTNAINMGIFFKRDLSVSFGWFFHIFFCIYLYIYFFFVKISWMDNF